MAAPVGATPDQPAPPATTIAASPATDDSVVDNEFIPQQRDLTECVSSVERPGCGSKARGGWRQSLVFGVVVAGLVFIGWQIVRSVRSGAQTQKAADADDAEVRR